MYYGNFFRANKTMNEGKNSKFGYNLGPWESWWRCLKFENIFQIVVQKGVNLHFFPVEVEKETSESSEDASEITEEKSDSAEQSNKTRMKHLWNIYESANYG